MPLFGMSFQYIVTSRWLTSRSEHRHCLSLVPSHILTPLCLMAFPIHILYWIFNLFAGCDPKNKKIISNFFRQLLIHLVSIISLSQLFQHRRIYSNPGIGRICRSNSGILFPASFRILDKQESLDAILNTFLSL